MLARPRTRCPRQHFTRLAAHLYHDLRQPRTCNMICLDSLTHLHRINGGTKARPSQLPRVQHGTNPTHAALSPLAKCPPALTCPFPTHHSTTPFSDDSRLHTSHKNHTRHSRNRQGDGRGRGVRERKRDARHQAASHTDSQTHGARPR